MSRDTMVGIAIGVAAVSGFSTLVGLAGQYVIHKQEAEIKDCKRAINIHKRFSDELVTIFEKLVPYAPQDVRKEVDDRLTFFEMTAKSDIGEWMYED